MPNPRPMIVAHRGLHSIARENSLAAFVAAADAGLGWVECDVWPSADLVPMVIHDPTLKRMTGRAGEVRQHRAIELADLGICTLGDVVHALNDLNAPGLLVEIKPRINRPFVQSVLNTISEYDGTLMVQSFYEDNIVRTWSLESGMHTAMLVESAGDLSMAVDRGWPFINSHYSLIDADVVNRMHGSGRRIGAWTVNTSAEIDRMIRLGVDMVITDDPMLAMELASSTFSGRPQGGVAGGD